MAFASLISFLLADITRKRDVPGVGYFSLSLLSMGIWGLFNSFEEMANALPIKILLSKISYLGIVSVAPLLFLFIIHFLQKDKPIGKFWRIFIWVIPAVILIAAVTNESHGLVWSEVVKQSDKPEARAIYGTGPLKIMNMVYSYTLIFVSLLLVIKKSLQSNGDVRKQMNVLSLSIIIPWFANIWYVSGRSPGGIDITTVAFTVMGIFISWGIFGFGFLNIVPVAWENLFNILDDCVLVFDNQYRLIAANAVAKRIFNVNPGRTSRLQVSKKSSFNDLFPQIGMDLINGEIEIDHREYYFQNSKMTGPTGQKFGNMIVLCDVTEENLTERSLRESETNFRTFFETIDDIILVTTREGKILYGNAAFIQKLGYNANEISDMDILEVFPAEKYADAKEIFQVKFHGGRSSYTLSLVNKKGASIPVETRVWLGRWNGVDCIFSVFRDVTEKEKYQKQIEYLSFHDHLTGLYNFRFFEEELKRLDTDRNLPLTVMMLDVNGLKMTNDTFGHNMGDALLKKVSEIIKQACRIDDIIARIGGDEFAIILPKTDPLQAILIKQRIIESAEKETLGSIVVSVAVGSDTKHSSAQNIREVVKASENEMYHDKIKTSKMMRDQTIQLIINTLNEKYENEQTDSGRVAALSEYIGIALNLPENDLKYLEIAGTLHDIGKIVVPYEIINKSGKITSEEYEIIKRHPEAGYQILRSVDELAPIADYVLSHHEKWDGTGYPRNLKGEEIPLIARIIAVADAYEAMTANGKYHKIKDKETAKQELVRNSGTQFDPDIVKVFLNILSTAGNLI
ncbi:MAG: histidine kinase N-terminal 7TM domain-containing protein [Flexilinea sp.]